MTSSLQPLKTGANSSPSLQLICLPPPPPTFLSLLLSDSIAIPFNSQNIPTNQRKKELLVFRRKKIQTQKNKTYSTINWFVASTPPDPKLLLCNNSGNVDSVLVENESAGIVNIAEEDDDMGSSSEAS
jgi:hypothetical protein